VRVSVWWGGGNQEAAMAVVSGWVVKGVEVVSWEIHVDNQDERL
jgi:hypothetical protein